MDATIQIVLNAAERIGVGGVLAVLCGVVVLFRGGPAIQAGFVWFGIRADTAGRWFATEVAKPFLEQRRAHREAAHQLESELRREKAANDAARRSADLALSHLAQQAELQLLQERGSADDAPSRPNIRSTGTGRGTTPPPTNKDSGN